MENTNTTNNIVYDTSYFKNNYSEFQEHIQKFLTEELIHPMLVGFAECVMKKNLLFSEEAKLLQKCLVCVDEIENQKIVIGRLLVCGKVTYSKRLTDNLSSDERYKFFVLFIIELIRLYKELYITDENFFNKNDMFKELVDYIFDRCILILNYTMSGDAIEERINKLGDVKIITDIFELHSYVLDNHVPVKDLKNETALKDYIFKLIAVIKKH